MWERIGILGIVLVYLIANAIVFAFLLLFWQWIRENIPLMQS